MGRNDSTGDLGRNEDRGKKFINKNTKIKNMYKLNK